MPLPPRDQKEAPAGVHANEHEAFGYGGQTAILDFPLDDPYEACHRLIAKVADLMSAQAKVEIELEYREAARVRAERRLDRLAIELQKTTSTCDEYVSQLKGSWAELDKAWEERDALALELAEARGSLTRLEAMHGERDALSGKLSDALTELDVVRRDRDELRERLSRTRDTLNVTVTEMAEATGRLRMLHAEREHALAELANMRAAKRPPSVRIAALAERELAKLLCTIGLRGPGTVLWNDSKARLLQA